MTVGPVAWLSLLSLALFTNGQNNSNQTTAATTAASGGNTTTAGSNQPSSQPPGGNGNGSVTANSTGPATPSGNSTGNGTSAPGGGGSGGGSGGSGQQAAVPDRQCSLFVQSIKGYLNCMKYFAQQCQNDTNKEKAEECSCVYACANAINYKSSKKETDSQLMDIKENLDRCVKTQGHQAGIGDITDPDDEGGTSDSGKIQVVKVLLAICAIAVHCIF